MTQPFQERNWEAILSALPLIVTVLDRDLRVLEQFNGHDSPLAAAPGDPFLHEFGASMQMARETRTAVQVDDFMPGDEPRCYLHHIAALPDSGELVISSLDITERKRLEAQSTRLQRWFNAVLNNSNDAIAISTYGTFYDDSRFIAGNNRLVEMTGYSLEELAAMRASDLIDPEFLSTTLKRRAQRDIDKPFSNLSEAVGRRKDGTLYPFESLGVNIPDDEGNFIESFAFVRDISERKQREHALVEAQLKAETALKARDVFIANMSHELRSPLNVIQTHVQVLLDESELTPEFVEALHLIDYSADYLNRLIGDILDLSRVEAGFDALHSTDFNPHFLFYRLRRMSELQAKRKGLTLTLQVDSSVPSLIRMDETKLKQIIINIVDNAIKYTAEGGVSVHVAVMRAGMLHCVVSDTGTGIPNLISEGTHQPFVRGQKAPGVPPGSGLGLAITQRLLDLMGGRLVIDGRPSGSSVMMDIPFEPASSPPAADPPVLPLANELAALPHNWLSAMYTLCVEANHVEAAQHVRQIAASFPAAAARLDALIQQYWTAQIADAIAPLLKL